MCRVWGLDKGFTLTLFAASPTMGPHTVKSTATAIKQITWILPVLGTSFVIMGIIIACIH